MRLDSLVRSERHFTSGLLLHLLLHDELDGVDRFLGLLVARGILDASPVACAATDPRTQVIAEFAARRDLAAAGGVIDHDVPRDVIDMVVVVGDVLVAVEAKFFTRPTEGEIRDQLATQRHALQPILQQNAFGVSRIVQVFLEHGRQLTPAGLGCEGVLTWDDVHELACEVLGEDAYVVRQLTNARTRCDKEFAAGERGGVHWAGRLDFAQMVNKCRALGPAVNIGYDGGVRKLLGATADGLRARAWKWDDADSARNGRKKTGNWIGGDQMLVHLAELGALDEVAR